MDRRNFLKAGLLTGVGGIVFSAADVRAAEKEAAKPTVLDNLPDTAVGMLYDSTLCVGCQACVAECQNVNGTPVNPAGEQTWSNNDKLSPFTRNVIQVWTDGDGKNKDQPDNGYAYIKKQCMHCVDPNCVAVCPVQALTKNPVTGIVGYDPDICTGCRYCMVGCPFDVPKYDYDNPVGQISKCELCNQKGVERIDKGELPGCCHVCPTGAIIFGKRNELMAEAERRLRALRGSDYDYPRQHVNSTDTYRAAVPFYRQHIYGKLEGGGTQVLVLSAVPMENLGLPPLDQEATGSRAAHLQHFLYRGMVLPLVGLAGLSMMTYKNMHGDRIKAMIDRLKTNRKEMLEEQEKGEDNHE